MLFLQITMKSAVKSIMKSAVKSTVKGTVKNNMKNETKLEYTVRRSRRKTVGLHITDEGPVVNAPFSMSDADIEAFVKKHRRWLGKHLREYEETNKKVSEQGKLTPEDIRELAGKAKEYIPQRVKYYASVMGVTYGRITIRNQKTRWGSCSLSGNLNFNCLLMLAPEEVIDSVVVHELCHLKEMNHSKKFYEEVYRIFPQYDRWHGWLKENGPVLMGRMTSR